MNAQTRRLTMRTMVVALLASALASDSVALANTPANKLVPNVGQALGGAQKPGYQPSAGVRFRRMYRAPARLGAAAAMTIQAPSIKNVMTNVGYLDVNHYNNVRDVA